MTTSPTLSTLRQRLYELDAAYAKEGLPMNEYRDIAADIAEIAPRVIREQHRLLMEAKEVVDECHDQLWHLAKKPESSVLVQKAKDFLRQLEESV